jgi:2-methylisocitrate lyase-like PEP mutase family enzyme
MRSLQVDKAESFRSLHIPGAPIVVVNAWDVASARITEAAGVAAIATTSAGMAWSLGAPDGDQLSRMLALEAIRRIVSAVDLPVTVDIESGYAPGSYGVGDTIRRVIAAGVVGVNLEDGLYVGDSPLRDVSEQAKRIVAARNAADGASVPLFINARVDTYLRDAGDSSERLVDTLARARAYLNVGADGIFVPGVIDIATIAALTASIAAPVNIMVGPGSPTVEQLTARGVARISLGASVACAAYGLVKRAAREALDTGTYTALDGSVGYGDMNALLGQR